MERLFLARSAIFCSSVVCSWCTSDLRSSTLDFKEGSVTRAGSGFSGSFVSGFPTARLGFTLRRGHEATEHLSTKGTWVPPFLGLVCLSIHG